MPVHCYRGSNHLISHSASADDFDCRPRNWVACESPISSYTREATTIGIGRNICGVCYQTKTYRKFRNSG